MNGGGFMKKNSAPVLSVDNHLTYFGKMVCVFAVNNGMKAAAKDAASKVPFASVEASSELGALIVERFKINVMLQPKIDLNENRVCGFEAFAAPELGGKRLPAAVFVPSIEMSGLQSQFDWRVLSVGFALAGSVGADSGAPISFNVSPVTLCEPGFAQRLESLATKNGVDLNGVKIEILEKMPLNVAERVTMKWEMTKARNMGFNFSIDDFGTGDANCGMLDLPASELKIDAFYVRSLDARPAQRWVASMIKLAKNKGMSICAEGVEHEWQSKKLKEMGVDVGQGYLWSKSIEADSALALVGKSVKDSGADTASRLNLLSKLDLRRSRVMVVIADKHAKKVESTL
jgi:EAL domain-containing protein (putative c-di-GMP-specific phosphodiesterase class I)